MNDAAQAIVAMNELRKAARQDGRISAFRDAHTVCVKHWSDTKNQVAFDIAREIFGLIEAEVTTAPASGEAVAAVPKESK